MTAQNLPESQNQPFVTAQIIPFPGRHRPPAAAPNDRLHRAVESLNRAMEDQQKAVAAWREVLADLKSSTGRLDKTLRTYRDNLGTLGTRVLALQDRARALEAWADGVLDTAAE